MRYLTFKRCSLVLLISSVIIQFSYIVYFNLSQFKYHLGYDASAYMLKSIEMARQGKIFIEHWEDQTSLYLDSTVPLAAIFYKVTNDIYLSWGISNIIILIIEGILVWKIVSKFTKSSNSKLITINLFIASYFLTGYFVGNDLGYSSMMFLGTSMYAFKMITLMLVMLCVLDILESKYKIIKIIISLFLLLVTGMSSGSYMFFTIVIPGFLYILIKIFVKNNYRDMNLYLVSYLFLSSVVIFLGKYITNNLLGFAARDVGMKWTGYTDFWNNLGVFLMGLPQALSVMSYSSNIEILSVTGISIVFGWGIILLMISALCYCSYKLIKSKGNNSKGLYLGAVVCVNTSIFIFSYTLYDGQEDVFQVRYLIPLLIIYFISIGIWIGKLNYKLIISKFIILLFILCIFGMNFKSNSVYMTTKTNYDELLELTEIINNYNQAPVVYFVGDSIDARNLRIVDDSKIYKYLNENGDIVHWGDYLYYDDYNEYPNEVIIVSKNQGLNNLSKYYNESNHITSFNDYEIYELKKNNISVFYNQ